MGLRVGLVIAPGSDKGGKLITNDVLYERFLFRYRHNNENFYGREEDCGHSGSIEKIFCTCNSRYTVLNAFFGLGCSLKGALNKTNKLIATF
jgi:hypothetical protein